MPPNAQPASHPTWLNAPLAIVGMACRLPGADGLEQYWELLRGGGYPIERMPDTKLDRELYFHPDKGQRGKTYADMGGFVTERELDWSLLNISAEEATGWDACHLNFCEVAARACVHAGFDPRAMANRNVGVFVGHSGGTTLGGELAYSALAEEYVALLDSIPDWQRWGNDALKQKLHALLVEHRPRRRDGQPWVDASYAAGVVSRLLGLNGPHMSIDAACASSLVALALGAMSIHSGQTDMAIIGGASFNKTDSLILFSHAQSCSSSVSRPFDEQADGLISSEGYVALVIKSLARAQADGDRIQAVVHGIGIATDGRGKSLWAPRKEGQYAAIERAYAGEVTPDSVHMIEAHATSTHLGDATEMEALAAFYGQHLPAGMKLPVGSVKSNIGHTLETAGLAGVVKSVLAIQHGTIPPTINVEQPSRSIPWSDIPMRIADHAETWPMLTAAMPRRAAVNAFGIGGLNVHVVVEQAPPEVSRANSLQPKTLTDPISAAPALEPIAIIGRGCVLPGALDISQLKQLLQSGKANVTRTLRHTIDDFHYDWRKHKVPPKQIAQANPLQFMLLEAAEQALREAGLLERAFDRSHTAVVVGSVFGGDFGNALYAGLRLPEFRKRLYEVLAESGGSAEQVTQLADNYEAQFLKRYPALLDETGSFTSSTLASRLSKTFDLMGGALAIDAGDCSGFAALNSACQLLHSGTVKLVLCAAAQRALDLAAMENLSQCGRLPGTACAGEGYSVGEGVALVLLKPLSAAHRDGDRVLATIDAMGVGFDGHSLPDSMAAAARRLGQPLGNRSLIGGVGIARLDDAVGQLTRLPNADVGRAQDDVQRSPNLPLTGHLQAAQGLVDLIAVSLQAEPSSALILAHAQSGQSYLVAASASEVGTLSSSPTEVFAAIIKQPAPAVPSKSQSKKVSDTLTTRPRIYRFQANTLEQLKEQLSQVSLSSAANPLPCVHGFSKTPAWRAAIACQPHELSGQSHKLSLLVGNRQALSSAMDQGLLWRAPATEEVCPAKVAWLFPGQGSQYQGMLESLCRHDHLAAQALDEVNVALEELGQPAFDQLAWSSSNELGESVWHTQAAMLVADWIMLQSLRGRGLTCDIISGHSFGELPAMLAAGCWSLTDALRATWERCRSLVEHGPSGCAMLSVQADAERVNQIIVDSRLALTISHRNAPNQTVVGGKQAHIAQLAARVEEEGLMSRLLPVPTAFHTPALDAARQPFRLALQPIAIHPPRTPLLSSVDNRFVAEPDAMRDGLARQLSTPLDFVALVKRLECDGVTLAIEVGPQQVLTRLVRQTTDQLLIVPSDHAKLGAIHQLQIVEALAELHDIGSLTDSSPAIRTSGSSHLNRNAQLNPSSVRHFDATQARKSRLRLDSQTSGKTERRAPSSAVAPKPPVHFDATEPRRGNHREQAVQLSPPMGQGAPRRNSPTHHTPKPAEYSPSPSPASASPSTSADNPLASAHRTQAAIETFLVDFVVEQTGYPAEIIELDWDIEADLGIDSIKKAQLFGELREFFDLESHASLKLDDYRSLRDIAELLHATPGKADWLTSAQVGETATSTLERSESSNDDLVNHDSESRATMESRAKVESNLYSVEELTAFLVDFVVEQTGYPPEIIELDADLEADLGIDSIKKAQLFGELRELFSIDPKTLAGQSSQGGGELRTLRHILELLLAQHSVAEGVGPEHGVPPLPESEQLESVHLPNPSPRCTTRLPILDLTQSIDSVRLEFARAVAENLRAMVARRDCGALSSLPTNGHWSEYQVQTQRLAKLCGVPTASLQAFERTLVTEAHWQPLNTTPRQTRTSHLTGSQSMGDRDAQSKGSRLGESCDDGVLWLAGLRLPAWLTSRGTPLGLSINAPGQVAICPPGSVTPLAVLVGKCLRVAGLYEPGSAVPQRQLSAALLALRGEDSDTLIAQGRRWEIAADWWLLIADSGRQSIALLESRGGELTVCIKTVGEFANVTNTQSTEADVPLVAMLGYDRQTESFIVRCQQLPPPNLPLEETLPWIVGQSETLHTKLTGLPETRAVETPRAQTCPTVANRYVLRMVPAPQPSASGRQPEWAGTALVVGDNPVARQLEARLRGAGVEVVRWAASTDPQELANRFVSLTRDSVVPHLFLLTPCDPGAQFSLDESAWKARRQQGILSNFWLCQKWFEHISSRGLADDASLLAVSTLGGDFGIGGHIQSAEGGGIGGLLKSILIESWMQGYRALPIKTIDTASHQSPAEIVEVLWRELSIPSYDNEIATIDGNRHVVRAVLRPLDNHRPRDVDHPSPAITRGGTWVCTGGARGITAYVTEKLALRYGLKLHLLGTAPKPELDVTWRQFDETQLRKLKVQVMTAARQAGRNPVKTWQDTEKAIEIDATLQRLKKQGIEVTYHSCDCSDRSAVRDTLQNVREISGPIHGVLHGAGVGKDSRFDRKQPEKVEQCIAAKVDGALALMAATWDDPLECFIGFGSISGRFGANGHTDYSLANDMLCKTIDWLRGARPDVRAIGFHWHAWGDVGMATKPETRLALEMIDMQFMPAEEGFQHLVAEIEGGAGESEVLITDDRYYRMFYPAETILSGKSASSLEQRIPTPLLKLVVADQSQANGAADRQCYLASVNPAKDPFLTEHLLDARPLLPFVVAAEMLLEAGQHQLGSCPGMLRDLTATAALRFFTDATQQLRIETHTSSDSIVSCRLLSDFVARDGRVVDPNRVNFTAQVVASEPHVNGTSALLTRIGLTSTDTKQSAQYPAPGSKFYVGWPLQRLKKVALVEGGIVGNISAPALVELAGGGRDVIGWRIPSAALDACLFAVGMLAWQQVAAGTALPVRMGQLRLGRLPTPGEACQVHAQLIGSGNDRATFNFTLYGVDESVLVDVVDYEVAWLSSEPAGSHMVRNASRGAQSPVRHASERG